MVLLHEGLVRGLDIVLLYRRGIGRMNRGCAFGLDFGLVFRAIAGKQRDGNRKVDVSMRTVQTRGSVWVYRCERHKVGEGMHDACLARLKTIKHACPLLPHAKQPTCGERSAAGSNVQTFFAHTPTLLRALYRGQPSKGGRVTALAGYRPFPVGGTAQM